MAVVADVVAVASGYDAVAVAGVDLPEMMMGGPSSLSNLGRSELICRRPSPTGIAVAGVVRASSDSVAAAAGAVTAVVRAVGVEGQIASGVDDVPAADADAVAEA